MKYIFWIFPLLLFAACDLDVYKQDDYNELYVVEGFLVADKTFPQIRISTTARIGERYDFGDRAVDGAAVRVFELNESGTKIAAIVYQQDIQPGVYVPVSTEETVKPGTRYALEVSGLPDPDAFITSQTYVPQRFEIVHLNTDTLRFQGPMQFEINITRGVYPGRQNIYVFTTEALDTANYPLTPLYRNEFAEDFGGESFQLISSPGIHEGNYEINDDNTINIRLPWLMIAYLGPNRISAYAIDDNIYDFYRSADVQLGGSTQSPGEIENVIYRVEGGIGLFGSMAGISTDIYVQPGP